VSDLAAAGVMVSDGGAPGARNGPKVSSIDFSSQADIRGLATS
jgi:hypothetical protein